MGPILSVVGLSLRAVRDQRRRIALIQTNREDCGKRYHETFLPNPLTRKWVCEKSAAFRNHFRTIAEAKQRFIESIHSDNIEYIANVVSIMPLPETEDKVVDSHETRLNLFAGI